MSSDSVIEEDIFEQIDTGSSEDGNVDKEHHSERNIAEEIEQTDAEKLEDKGLIVHGVNQCRSENTVERSVEELDETRLKESSNTEEDTLLETKHNGPKLHTDIVDKVNIALINYSGLLAESVVQEALLINEIYTKDSINIGTDKVAEDRDRDIRKHLFPNENGRIASRDNGSGYDPYLLDKLLRSKADPEEVADAEGFDGNEEHFKRNKDETYPGLDSDDAYVKAELDRANSAREFSDKNNNQMVPGLVDPFEDNVLQTIHEDSELVIENGLHDDQNDSLQEVAEANVEKVSDSDYIAEDEMSFPDNEHPAEDLENNVTCSRDNDHKLEIEKIAADDKNYVKEVPLDDDESDASEDERDCCEMTFKEKQAVVKAVRKGDINLLEKLLEKKNADMGLNWYGENLLMVAIRSVQQEMAEFLIDNDIDWQYERKLVEVEKNGTISVHKETAREMAYHSNMDELVELLDRKMNNLFPFVKPKPRVPRLRQPIAPFEPPPLDEGIREEWMIDPDEAKRLQKQAVQEYKKRQREIELENLEMMQRRRKGLTSATENESVHTAKSRRTCSDLNIIHDDISQVFGPDEGYETTSPVSPHRHDFHVPDIKDQISIRSTRAFHLKKAFIASKTKTLKRTESPDYPMFHNNLTSPVGSYNFESRRWHVPRSAPPLRNYSTESLQASSVHMGLPFVHDEKRKVMSARIDRKSALQGRIKSAHDNISPYSQVAKLLEQSRLFSPVSRSSTPYFPSISSKKTNGLPLTKTRINYIYADRSSAKPKRSDVSSFRTELLPKRKINC